MENKQRILKVLPITPMRQIIKEMAAEIDAGMKLIGYAPLELDYTSNEKGEKVIAYKNDELAVTFYITGNQTLDMKVMKLDTESFAATTRFYRFIGVRDIAPLLKIAN